MGLGNASTSLPRCALVWSALTGAAALSLHWLLPAVLAGGPSGGSPAWTPFEDALVRCCSALAVGVTLWLWVTVTLVTLDAARGRLHGRRCEPAALRRAVLAACGVALTSGVLTPALAGAGAGPVIGPVIGPVDGPVIGPVDATHASGPGVLRGLRLPERVGVRPLATPAPPPPAAPSGDVVVVATGDSLWSIAQRALGPGATTEQIAAYWPEVYRGNADVVGADPDLIEPGQRLHLPPRTELDGGAR